MPHYTYISPHKGTSKSRRASTSYREPEKVKYVADGSTITFGGSTINATSNDINFYIPTRRSYPSYLNCINYATPYRNLASAANTNTTVSLDAQANAAQSVTIFSYLPEEDLYDITTNGSMTTYLTNLADYLDDRRAAGFTVVLCTTLPRSDYEWNDYWRKLQNNVVMGWVGTHCDSVCDFGGISAMYNVSNTELYTPSQLGANSTYSNGVFPTDLGQKILSDFLKDHVKTYHHVNL